jgi:hypothetical protein
MDHVSNPFAYIVAYAFAIFVTPYLHEGSHWAVGKLGGTEPTVNWGIMRWVWPQAVRHNKIATMDADIIRFSGLSIFLWLPPWVLSLGYLAENITPYTVVTSLVPFLVVFGMATESDALAVRDPEEYRERSMDDKLSADPLFNWMIVSLVLLSCAVYPVLPL